VKVSTKGRTNRLEEKMQRYSRKGKRERNLGRKDGKGRCEEKVGRGDEKRVEKKLSVFVESQNVWFYLYMRLFAK
jgi:hypothetical protein